MGRQGGGDAPGKWHRESEQVEEEAQTLQAYTLCVCVPISTMGEEGEEEEGRVSQSGQIDVTKISICL